MNLLARYAHVNIDAPVQSLPSGSLQPKTSKRFLELTRKNFLNAEQIEHTVKSIKSVVRAHVKRMKLTKMTSLADMEGMCRDILQDLRSDRRSALDETNGHNDPISEIIDHSLWNWALYDKDINNVDQEETRDYDYELLVQEAIDLGEILDFGEVIVNNSFLALQHALNCLKQDLDSSGKKNPLPFAYCFAHFSDIGSKLLSETVTASDSSQTSSPIDDCMSELEARFSADLQTSRFAACVFLSGEKEGKQEQQRLQQRAEPQAEISGPSPYVTNISHPIEETPEDLGLMFDVEQADS